MPATSCTWPPCCCDQAAGAALHRKAAALFLKGKRPAVGGDDDQGLGGVRFIIWHALFRLKNRLGCGRSYQSELLATGAIHFLLPLVQLYRMGLGMRLRAF